MIQFLASALGTRNVLAATVDLVANYGAASDGASDSAAFLAFQTEFLAETGRVMLTIPAGTFHFGTTSGIQFWMNGIDNAVIAGAGEGTTTLIGGATPIQLGGKGLTFDNAHSARCASVTAGATSVTLLTEADAALFTVGQYALMAGFDLMGFGDPCNPHFFDYVIVTAKAGAVISFDRTLTNDYLSTWPLFNDGSNWATGGGMDQGGPATLYAIQSTFAAEVEVRDMTITQTAWQTYAQGTSITYRNVAFGGAHGSIPTQNELFRYIDCDLSTCNVEVDKVIHRIEAENTTFNHVKFQSSSTNEAVFTDCTFLADLSGTAKRIWIYGGTIATFLPGAYSLGSCEQVTIEDTVISVLSLGGFVDQGDQPSGAGVTVELTMDDDTIILPPTVAPPRWAVPGTWCCWTSTHDNIGMFQILSVSRVSTDVHVVTSWSGGFPAVISPATVVNIRTHPCPDWHCVGATGCAEIEDYSQAGAQGRPLYEYSKRTYTDLTATGAGTVRMWGAIVSIKINVTTAYTGGGALSFLLSRFSNWPMMKISDRTISNLVVTINAKIAGERIIATAGNSGAQSLDSLPDITAGYWLMGVSNSGPAMSTTVTGHVVTVEIETDQGIS